MSKAKTTTEVLKAAKWMLENVGWSQGTSYRDANGAPAFFPHRDLSVIKSMCLVGAFNLVDTLNPLLRNEAIISLKTKGGILNTLESFNDNPLTTKKDVIALLRKVRGVE